MFDPEIYSKLHHLNGHLDRDEVVPIDLHMELVALGVDVDEYIGNYEPNYGDRECPTTLETIMTTSPSMKTRSLELPLI